MLMRAGIARLLAEAGVRDRRTRRATPPSCCARSPDRSLTSRSSTSECLLRRQTKGSSPQARSASRYPNVGVLVLSQFVAPSYAIATPRTAPPNAPAISSRSASRTSRFSSTAADGSPTVSASLDPTIVSRLVAPSHASTRPLYQLTDREREVLGSNGRRPLNAAIAERLVRHASEQSRRTFVRSSASSTSIESVDDHRRVLAVLTYLRS